MNSTDSGGDKPSRACATRICKSGGVFMLLILLSMALLAVFANVHRSRQNKIEAVIVKPANP